MAKHKVVVVGAGFGGLSVVQRLNGAGCDITLIDRRNHHLFQPLLYQVATTVLSPSDVAWPVRHLMRGRPDVRTLMATVTGVDPRGQSVFLAGGESVHYDTLVLATGATHAYFGHDDWAKHAPGLKTLEDATAIRAKLLLAFERAEREPVPAARQALLTFVVIGGGATGVELAGSIIELARVTLKNEFRTIAPNEARVMLIEAGPRILPVLKPELSKYAHEALEKLGVIVEVNQPVSAVTADTVVYGERRVGAKTVLWAAGVQASAAAQWLNVPADRAGRVKVNPDLSVPGFHNVFVIGDTATIPWKDGKTVPGIGDAAKQAGKHVARVIRERLNRGTPNRPFSYKHLGDIATVGRRAAVIDFGWLQLTGILAWWAWGVAHIYFLIGTRARLFVAFNWLYALVSGRRGARLITQADSGGPAAPPRSAPDL